VHASLHELYVPSMIIITSSTGIIQKRYKGTLLLSVRPRETKRRISFLVEWFLIVRYYPTSKPLYVHRTWNPFPATLLPYDILTPLFSDPYLVQFPSGHIKSRTWSECFLDDFTTVNSGVILGVGYCQSTPADKVCCEARVGVWGIVRIAD
jgi:hypothetical protein